MLFKIQDTVFKERKLLDISKPIQAPSTRYVIERYFTIKKEVGVRVSCKDIAFFEAACELQELWIFLNLQPKCHSQIVILIKKLMLDVEKLKRYPSKKQSGDAFKKAFGDLSAILENGFDVRTSDLKRIEELEKKYFVKMSEDSEEEKLYVDNCVPLKDDKPPLQKGRCPMLMWSTTMVDQDWLKAAHKRSVNYL